MKYTAWQEHDHQNDIDTSVERRKKTNVRIVLDGHEDLLRQGDHIADGIGQLRLSLGELELEETHAHLVDL